MGLKIKIIDYSKKNAKFRYLLRKCLYMKKSIFNIPNLFTKIDDKLIVFESYMGRSYDCSPKFIYEEMLNDPYFKEYKFIWAFKTPYIDCKEKEYIKDARTTVVEYNSKFYYKAYAKAKYWITNSRLPEQIKKKKKQIYIQCWHGTPLKRLGHDIIENTQSTMNNKKEIKKRYTKESDKFDYFISPSKFCTEKFKSAFDIKNEKIIIEEGYPRNVSLFNYDANKVIEIKKKFNIPLDKKVILYCPTFRDNEHQSGIGYVYKPHIDFDYLKEKLGNEYVVLYRPHYLVANEIDVSKYKNFVIYDKAFIGNTNDLYLISNLLLTDYSSAFFDFANLNRPIIFYMYDLDHYENDLRGFYISLDELPGKIVKTEKEICEQINNITKYNIKYQEKYKKLKEKYLYLDDENASKRVIKRIFKEW